MKMGKTALDLATWQLGDLRGNSSSGFTGQEPQWGGWGVRMRKQPRETILLTGLARRGRRKLKCPQRRE